MTTKTASHLSRAGLALALGLTGCGTDHAATRTPEPAEPNVMTSSRQDLQRSVRESLEHLDKLQLFTVGSLVLELPENARECYGVPCPGDAQGQAAYDAELARQAERLSSLVRVAESCNSGHCYVSTPTSAEQAVEALNALQVVRVSALLTVEPKNDPACYNVPCPGEVERAREENERRQRLAFTIANTARGL